MNSKGFISDELFASILAKITAEFSCRQLHFYNWTEPLLHPRIVEYCRAAVERGFHVHLSSNLNHLRDEDELLSSGIKTFRISLSGYFQDVYAIGHRGGNIENVKRNMRRMAEAHRRVNSRTRVHVYFHKYRHNLDDVEPMMRLADELGFEFASDWAFLMPIEKIIAYASGTLDADECDFADASLLPRVDAALAHVRDAGASTRACSLIEQLVLDHQGRALLCCGSFDHATNVIGNFLELDWDTLQKRRYAHHLCMQCTSIGAHAYCTSVSDPTLRGCIDALAMKALDQPVDSMVTSLPIVSACVSSGAPLS